MNQLIYRLHYFDAPVVKAKDENFLVLESTRNKVWNPVFTIGTVSFFLSMTLRGFFDQQFAVFPLALSTLLLFSGVWILSAHAEVIFDKNESKVYFVYKHLGYLQKIYTYPLTSFEEVELIHLNSKFRLQLHRDNGGIIRVADRVEFDKLFTSGNEIASFLRLPLKK